MPCAAALALALSGAGAGATGPDFERALNAVVGVKADVPGTARTAETLGTSRLGSGVVIDGNGLVLTIGYLILEAQSAHIVLGDFSEVDADIVAYDYETGFGLLRARAILPMKPVEIGTSAGIKEGDPVLFAGFGGPAAARPAVVVSRRDFAGYWEYLLENAIFTTPPYRSFGGAALIGDDGRLVGIGSLVVGDASQAEQSVPGNMAVPIDALKPILGDLLVEGRGSGPGNPWLGIYTEEVQGHLVVTRVAPDGPAARAGIVRGDILVGVAGEPVRSQIEFYRKVWALGGPGVEIPLTVVHGIEIDERVLISSDRYRWLLFHPSTATGH